jgi:hypothetical protein
MVTWSFCADYHGDKHDKVACAIHRTFVEDFRPTIKVFGGDLWDFRAWRRGADEDEKRERVRTDFDAGMKFIEWYRPVAITLGNHDIRLWDQRDRQNGPMSDFAGELIGEFEALAAKLKIRVLPYCKRRGIYRVGKMKFAHGFFCGPNAARQMAQAFGSVQFGHGHTIDVASAASSDRRAARMVGALCQLDFPYNRATVNSLRHAHGWTYGPLLRSGNYQVFQAEVMGGKAVVAEGMKVISHA